MGQTCSAKTAAAQAQLAAISSSLPQPRRKEAKQDGATVSNGTPVNGARKSRAKGPDKGVHASSYEALDLIPDKNFPDCVLQHFYKNGNRVALMNGVTEEEMTFPQLRENIRCCAAGLQIRGMQKGDVIAIFAPNSPEWAVIFFGAMRCGVVLSTLNPQYRDHELGHQLSDSKAIVLITIPALLPTAKSGAARVQGQIKEFFTFGETKGATPFSNLLKAGPQCFRPVSVNPSEDLAVLPYSSGTTGLPKGVMLTHFNLVANLKQMGEVFSLNSEDCFLAVLPFFHIYGMLVILAMGLRFGTKIVTVPKFDPLQFLKLLKEQSVTTAHVAPPLMSFLAKHPAVNEVLPLPKLKEIFCGAAPLGFELALAVKNRLGIACVRQGYGMTEMSPASHASPFGCEKLGSCGKLVPNMECKIVDLTNGKLKGAGRDQVGEFWLKGPNVMKGYLNNPQATEETVDKQGFLHTGDVGYVDEEGYFFIIDRAKELIKVKAFQVAPAELEAVLTKHQDIQDAAVIGIAAPREGDGQVPKAFVVKKEGSQLTEQQVKDFVAQTVASYKQLGAVAFVNSIPKSASGKILRKDLRFKEALTFA
jgi:acyl-CoA synthetase (AMP-forming)/AMP-acid ligase II